MHKYVHTLVTWLSFFAPAYIQYALTNNIYKLLALCFFSQKKVFNQIETQVQENSDICGFSK